MGRREGTEYDLLAGAGAQRYVAHVDARVKTVELSCSSTNEVRSRNHPTWQIILVLGFWVKLERRECGVAPGFHHYWDL